MAGYCTFRPVYPNLPSEYDALQAQDPVQTFNFLPESSAKSRAKFSAVDPLSLYATAFAFSTGTLDFAPLMVYGLMANGDVYSIGPVLPLHAEVPASYIASLQAWVSERAKRLKKRREAASTPGQVGSAEHAALVGRVALQQAWVENIVKQVTAQEDDKPKRRGFGLRESSHPNSDRALLPPGYVRVHPPHLTASGDPAPGMHRPLMRQGPLLIDPAPQEVGNGVDVDEQTATDIAVIRATVESDKSDTDTQDSINIVAIAWSAGRVDLCLEQDAPEPRWITSRDPASVQVVLPLVESVLAAFPTADADAIHNNAPYFVLDANYSDVFYVTSTFGVDAISVAPWVGKLLAGDADLPPSQVNPLVETLSSNPVVGCVTFCNITLGYGLVAVSSSGQIAAVEMDFRDPDRELPPPPTPEQVADVQSILSAPFPSTTLKPADASSAIRKLPDGRKALQTIGAEHLRALATASSEIRARAESVRAASKALEHRLDSQVAEYDRQLDLVRDAAAAIPELRSRTGSTEERTRTMAAAQTVLVERLDAVLNALLAEYRPQIGEVERKWFDELERIQQRVQGAKRVPGMGHRAQVLKEQLDVVRPLAKTVEDAGGEYGTRQLRPLQAALGARSDELARMMRKMDALSVKVDGAEA